MLEVQGKYNTAKIFATTVDDVTIRQVIELCNQETFKNSKIRIMPDTHAGKGCVIGTTMEVKDAIVANLVGVDIGCGMLCTKIKPGIKIDFTRLDEVIRTYIPHGFNINEKPHKKHLKDIPFEKLVCRDQLMNFNRIELSLGSLGGGNHFCELNEDDKGDHYLVIHSGSRNLGKQVAELYQEKAIENLYDYKGEVQILIERLKSEGRHKDIQAEIAVFKKNNVPSTLARDLAPLKGQDMKDYLNDMVIAQIYASHNRVAMMETIFEKMGWEVEDQFETIHNYIDIDRMILRKGACSAEAGERILIPMNMRDGSIVAIGKGNEDWNKSAPHGAGRLMSRKRAKEEISFADFEETMKNVWTTSVQHETLDESPFVYKPMNEIVQAITPTADIQMIMKPVYNFKSSS